MSTPQLDFDDLDFDDFREERIRRFWMTLGAIVVTVTAVLAPYLWPAAFDSVFRPAMLRTATQAVQAEV